MKGLKWQVCKELKGFGIFYKILKKLSGFETFLEVFKGNSIECFPFNRDFKPFKINSSLGIEKF